MNQTDTTTTTPDTTKERWTYTGKRVEWDARGNAYYVYTWRDQDGLTRRFDKNIAKNVPVGGTFLVTVKVGGTSVSVVTGDGPDGPKWDKYAQTDEQVLAEWIALDQTARKAEAADKAKRLAEKDASLERVLDPLRRAYWSTSPQLRSQFIAQVVHEITRQKGGRSLGPCASSATRVVSSGNRPCGATRGARTGRSSIGATRPSSRPVRGRRGPCVARRSPPRPPTLTTAPVVGSVTSVPVRPVSGPSILRRKVSDD